MPFVIGVGISMAIPTVPTAALSAVSPADVGRASGVSNTMQRFGGAFGIALVSAVFAGYGHLGTAASFTAGLPARPCSARRGCRCSARSPPAARGAGLWDLAADPGAGAS